MSAVKPSKQYAMTVIPYRPYMKAFKVILLILFIIVTIVTSYFVGRYYNLGFKGSAIDEYATLQSEYKQELARSAKLAQQIANLKLATEVDRKANKEVRAQVVELETQLADLKQNNSFYRSLMRPATGDKGIVVDAPVVLQKSTLGEYKYNLVIKQIVTKHQKVSGYLTFILEGKREGKRVRLALKDISENVSVDRIRLSFKYFQKIEGSMVFPEGFVPEKIEMKVIVQGSRKTTIDKKFGWLVKES